MAKRRKYNESYLGFGFTTVTGRDGSGKPQCVICHDVLCEVNEAIEAQTPSADKASKVSNENPGLFQKMENDLKSQRLDATGTFHQQNSNVMEASFEIALQIAKQKKPHTIGETLIKSSLLRI